MLQCVCGTTIPCVDAPVNWLVAAHRADHHPGDVVLVPDELLDAALLLLDSAAAWAEVLAPELTVDLRAATNVMAVADSTDGRGARLHRDMIRKLSSVFRRATMILSATVVDETVVSELDSVACDLAEVSDRGDGAHLEQDDLDGIAFPRIAASSLAVTDRIATCMDVLRRPLLLVSFAPATEDEMFAQRSAGELVRELGGIPAALVDVESPLAQELQRVRFTAEPVAVASDTSLDRLAECVMDLHLARLRATHLAETLVASDDVDLVCWAAGSAERIITRLVALAEEVSLLLCYFQP